MGIVIGIDVGISTTKIVGIKNNKVSAPIRITAADPITSLYGAFGKYLHDNDIELKDVEHVMLTGVGAAYIDQPIYGLPTSKSQEFIADGLGARFESKIDHARRRHEAYRRYRRGRRHVGRPVTYHAKYQ